MFVRKQSQIVRKIANNFVNKNMLKYLSDSAKKFQKESRTFKAPQDKSVKRFSQNAARLEHSNVRNKNKGKKG